MEEIIKDLELKIDCKKSECIYCEAEIGQCKKNLKHYQERLSTLQIGLENLKMAIDLIKAGINGN